MIFTYFQTHYWRCQTWLAKWQRKSFAFRRFHCLSHLVRLFFDYLHSFRYYNYCCYYHYRRLVQSVWTSKSSLHINNNSTVALCYFFLNTLRVPCNLSVRQFSFNYSASFLFFSRSPLIGTFSIDSPQSHTKKNENLKLMKRKNLCSVRMTIQIATIFHLLVIR